MKKIEFKYGKYLIISLVLIALSIVCKVKVTARDNENNKVAPIVKNKEIVTLWTREAIDTETRKYQIEKFNKENKDVFIDFRVYKEDYFNLLRISLASNQKVDIFQYGYYELLKNKECLDLDKLGIDSLNINPNNYLNYDGKKFGIKTSGNNVKLLWNKEIFQKAGINIDQAPKTWDEVEKYSKIIKEKCPDVTPFEFPANTWGELKSSIGEIAASKGPIYTTFWNYNTGKYDFSYAKDILNVYSRLYKQDLTEKQLVSTGSIDMRRDFYAKKAAMIICNYEDRDYFSNVVPLGFAFGVTDLPKLNINDASTFYYTENYKCFVVNKDINNKEAVKTVLAWLVSNDTNQELLSTGKILPSVGENLVNKNDSFATFAEAKDFKHESLDPTLYTNYSPDLTRDLLIDAISGKKTVNDVINTLNTQYASYIDFVKTADKLDITKYTIKK